MGLCDINDIKVSGERMGYKEIDIPCGWNLKQAVKELHEKAKDGNKYYNNFNGDIITSDMSLDDAYMLCTGKTFYEFTKSKEQFFSHGMSFSIGTKSCDRYVVYIYDDNGYEKRETIHKNEIDGFVHCLKVLGYEEF